MHIGSPQRWSKYLAGIRSDRAVKLIQQGRRRASLRNTSWSPQTTQRLGHLYQLELCHRPTSFEIAFGNLLVSLNILPFEFQKQILKPKLYLLDFYIPKAFVCFEIDGGYHAKTKLKDALRDQILMTERGIKTYRFKNEEVFSENIKGRILKALSWN